MGKKSILDLPPDELTKQMQEAGKLARELEKKTPLDETQSYGAQPEVKTDDLPSAPELERRK